MTKLKRVGSLRLRLRGPQTVKTEVSRTFLNRYSLKPEPVDPRTFYDRDDGYVQGWAGTKLGFKALLKEVKAESSFHEGANDLACELVGQAMDGKKSPRVIFRKLFEGTVGEYEHEVTNHVYNVARRLAGFTKKASPREMDLWDAMGIVEVSEQEAPIYLKPPPEPPRLDRYMVNAEAVEIGQDGNPVDTNENTEAERAMNEPEEMQVSARGLLERLGYSNRPRFVADEDVPVRARPAQRRVR